MDILGTLIGQLAKPEVLRKLGSAAGVSTGQARQLTGLALPALLESLGKNACTREGASSLARALDRHCEKGGDDVVGFLDQVDVNDGNKMLGHIFGGGDQAVRQELGAKTGLDAGQVSLLLSQLAPLLMSTLGRQKQNLQIGQDDLPGMLSGLLNQNRGASMNLLTQALDADNDGNIMDDVASIASRLFKR